MKKLIYLLPLLLIGCEQKEDDSVRTEEKAELETKPELAVLKSQIQTVEYGGEELKVQEMDSVYLFEGDILIPVNAISAKVHEPGEPVKSAALESGFWPDNTVYYQIDPSLTGQYRVTDAIAHWEAYTNLQFVNKADAGGYIYFTPGSGCSSFIGKTGYKQAITLSSNCSTGNTIHEIGHAAGYWHEQSRADRDKFIKIWWENIRIGTEHNFDSYVDTPYGGQDLTPDLDFSSIMMYGPYSFSANGKPTITKVDGSLYNFQRSILSQGDIFGINMVYPAGEVEPTYVNGEWYKLHGLRVFRMNDKWYTLSRYKGDKYWTEVKLIDGIWYLA